MKYTKMAKQDAKERILNVAELLFSNNSFASVSIRSVTAQANVNLSAVNYYFGSKQGLFQAVYVRRATEMNHERLHLLYEASERAEKLGKELAIREILFSLVTPSIFWLYDQEGGRSDYIKFLARAYLEQASDMAHVLREEVDVFDKFVPYMQKAKPDLNLEDIYWRIHFIMGALHHTINHIDRIGMLSNGNCKVGTREETRDRVLEYCLNGF